METWSFFFERYAQWDKEAVNVKKLVGVCIIVQMNKCVDKLCNWADELKNELKRDIQVVKAEYI